MEKEIEKELWKGNIAVVIKLHKDDVTSLEEIPPLLISAPRNGFFTSLIEKVCSHFDKDEDKEKIWFSTPDDKPIQWHLPIGFLYDITCSTSSPDDLLPWIIIVRYSKFPHNTILELASGKTAEENFFHSLKQAMYIQHGTAKSVMSITRSEQSELWTAIMKCNYFEFKDSYEKLETDEKIRHVAIRAFTGDMPLVQKSLTFESESKGAISLQSALSQIPRASEAKRMIIQGIDATKLGSLTLERVYKIYRHPDNFLYVVFDL